MSSQPIPAPPQDASSTRRGLVSTGAQTLAGDKTFTGVVVAANLSGTNTGDVSLGAVGSSPNANGASLSGQVLTLQPADGSNPGVLTAGTQTIGGAKTFSGALAAASVASTGRVNAGTISLVGTGGTLFFQNTGFITYLSFNEGTGVATFPFGVTFNAQASSAQASGSNAFSALTGARWKIGGGTTDYLDSDGSTQVRANGNFGVLGARFDCRSANFSTMTLGTAGNAYFNYAMPGAQASLSLTSGQSTTESGVVPTVLSRNFTAVGSGADTTEDNLMTRTISSSVFTVDGMGIRITAWGDGVNTADATTVRCYFGSTLVVSKVLTASQANTWKAVFEVFRVGASSQVATGIIHNGGVAQSFIQSNASCAETSVSPITVKVTGQRATSSVANSVRQLGMLIEMIN